MLATFTLKQTLLMLYHWNVDESDLPCISLSVMTDCQICSTHAPNIAGHLHTVRGARLASYGMLVG
jgi:hypothetical protein